MTFKTLIDQYLLSLSYKSAKDQSKAFTDDHVVYKVKIKSPLLRGKLKTTYICNKTNEPQLEDILNCLKLDIMSVHPDYCKGVSDLARSFGYEDFEEATRVYNACQENLEKLNNYFGPAPIDQLIACEGL